MRCTAELRTAVITNQVVATIGINKPDIDYSIKAPIDKIRSGQIKDGVATIRDGDHLFFIDMNCPEKEGPHSCDKTPSHNERGSFIERQHSCWGCGVNWDDDWHGATPHIHRVTEESLARSKEWAEKFMEKFGMKVEVIDRSTDTHDVFPYGQQQLDGFSCRTCGAEFGPDQPSKAEEHGEIPIIPLVRKGD